MSGSTSTSAPPPPLTVRVTDDGFDPNHVKVVEDRPVRFVAHGSLSHMLTGPGLERIPSTERLIRPGGTFEHTFTESGALGDEVLSYVKGYVEVLPGGASAAPPAPAPEPAAPEPVQEDISDAASAEALAAAAAAPSSAIFVEPGAKSGRWSTDT